MRATARVAQVRRELGVHTDIQFARSANESRAGTLSDPRRLAAFITRTRRRQPLPVSALRKHGLCMALMVWMK